MLGGGKPRVEVCLSYLSMERSPSHSIDYAMYLAWVCVIVQCTPPVRESCAIGRSETVKSTSKVPFPHPASAPKDPLSTSLEPLLS